MTEYGMTRADLAAHLGLSVATIRKWQTLFADRMITPPGVKGMSQALIIDPADVAILAAVAELRQAGYSLDETEERLDRFLETAAPVILPELRPLEDSAAAISPALYVDALRVLEAAEATAAAIREERDYLRARIDMLEGRLREEAAARGAAEERARLATGGRTSTFWERFFGRSPG